LLGDKSEDEFVKEAVINQFDHSLSSSINLGDFQNNVTLFHCLVVKAMEQWTVEEPLWEESM
jgi:hypothetical protein